MSKIESLKRRLTQGFQATFQPTKLYIYPTPEYSGHCLSFSQYGEDMILKQFFGKNKKLKGDGFYVDVGAHHPRRFSNTYFFYLNGWRGINIDPIPGGMEMFNKLRSRDINVEVGISNCREKLTYFIFKDGAYNSFSKEVAETRRVSHIDTKEIDTYPLVEVLDKYLPHGQTIDFLNVDVEGLDYEVLQSNDWSKYKPHIILAEAVNTSSLEDAINTQVAKYLEQKGYKLITKTKNTLLFQESSSSY
jgi:FkbM family methyltransferase